MIRCVRKESKCEGEREKDEDKKVVQSESVG